MKLWDWKVPQSANWISRKARGIIQPRLKGLRTSWANGVNLCPRAGENEMKCLCWKGEAGKRGRWGFFHPYTDILDDTHPYWWQWSLLMLRIQMLISSEETLTDTSRNNALPAIWAPLNPVKLTCKINHHKCEGAEKVGHVVSWGMVVPATGKTQG